MSKRKTCFKLALALAFAAALLWLAVGCVQPFVECGARSLERANKTEEVFDKYRYLLVRYPNRTAFKKEFLRDEQTGELTYEWGIIIIVSELINEETLSPYVRIPDKLEGVPVQVITPEIYEKATIMQMSWPPKKDPHANLAYDVRERNGDLFRRNPFFKGISHLIFEPGGTPGNRIVGIKLLVSDEFDQSTLPSEQIIPRCLHDVPIKFVSVSDF